MTSKYNSNNIRTGSIKAPWLTALPTNPTPIKWQEIKGHVELCSEALKGIKSQIIDDAKKAKTLKEIKENAATIRKHKRILKKLKI